MTSLLLVLALAVAPASPVDDETARALATCMRLPIERQRTCIEPYLAELPPQVAQALRLETDPVLQAAATEWQRKIDDALRTRAATLAARGGARNLLAAALIMPRQVPSQPLQQVSRSPEALAWFAAARTAATATAGADAVLVAWVEASDCAWMAGGCDRSAPIARLLEVDPDNAAVHLMALGEATRRTDEADIAARVHAAAASPRFEPFMPDMLALMVEAHERITWPEPDPALGDAIASLSGMSSDGMAADSATAMAFAQALSTAAPPVLPIAMACPVGRLDATPGRRADCMAILELLAADGSALYRQFALSQLSQHTAGDAAGDHWRERLRTAYWLMETAGPLMPGQPGAAVGFAEYAQLFVEQGETGAMEAVLRRAGVPAGPPADWLPTDPSQRALVTSGVTPPE